MEDALDEEVRLSRNDDDYKKWKRNELPTHANGLTVCYDMGWNKRSSGRRYDSISGHGIVFGARSKKIISYRACSKICSLCEIFKRKNCENVAVEEHDCVKNHFGSSKSMECEAILYLTVDSWMNRSFHFEKICADDDTTMKKILRHNYDLMIEIGIMAKEDKPNKTSGKLDHEVNEPSFVADFNHRVKSVGRAIYTLAGLKVSESTVNNQIAKRVKLYWSEMLNQIKHLSVDVKEEWELIQKRVLAPIDHMFDCHENCDIAWCYALQARRDNKQYLPPRNRPFYCKQKDGKMYKQLCDAVRRFQTKETIAECLHPFNTQKNEAFNQMVARMVPKFKHFGTTPVLDTRIAVAASVCNIGYTAFYDKLINRISDTPGNTTSFVLSGIHKIQRKKLSNLSISWR